MRVLLIEDEPYLGEAVREHVAGEGHAVDWVRRLDEAEAALRAVDYELVLLDLHLPDGRGLDLLRGLRRAGDRRPVIILTARDQVRDRIEGLNAGADDYLVKPFDLDELSARVLAVARRYAGNPNPLLRVGEVELDCAARQARVEGRRVDLTRAEWAIVDLLARRPKAVVAKDRLEEALYAFGAEVESNALEAHVSRLRKKLGRGFVQTLRGVGYRLGE
jgi:two-component system OmpR family response regulator